MSPQQAAINILEELELKNQCPLPLQSVINHLGYHAQLFPKSDKTRNVACGVNADQKVIFANSNDDKAEQRYSFAHAIGHTVLHPGKNFVIRKAHLHHTNEVLEEWEANQFADELLMNSDVFLRKWDEWGSVTSQVAGVFGLSKERINVRAKALQLI